MSLDLVRSPDTLASVAGGREPPFTVGFAAETNRVAEHAREKLAKKRLDMIAANRVGPSCGFDKETNSLEVFWADGGAEIPENTKAVVARDLVALIAERYRATRSSVRSTDDSRATVTG